MKKNYINDGSLVTKRYKNYNKNYVAENFKKSKDNPKSVPD